MPHSPPAEGPLDAGRRRRKTTPAVTSRLVRLAAELQRRLPASPGGRAIFRLLLAAVLGLAAGYGSILFRALIAAVNHVAFPYGFTLAELHVTPWWALVLAPAAGGLVVGPLVHYLAPEAQGHGVPEVKYAVAKRGGRIRPHVAAVKIIASGFCIGSGGSVGREGPIVQIGSGVGSGLGWLVGLRGQYLVDFVAAGAAGGIAAAFNAPMAGVMFAIEVILGRSSPRHFAPLIVAAVIATVIVHHHLGASPAFSVPAYHLVSGWELPFYALLGLFAAFVGVLFIRGLYGLEDVWERIKIHPVIRAATGGAAVGALAIVFPEVLGVGYSLIEQLLSASHSLAPQAFTLDVYLVMLILAKILAAGTTIGSGGSGGVFAPSLFLGACVGGACGDLTGRMLPQELVGPPNAYALVGMGAVVGATTHAPLTAILIVFEMCNRHSIILPLMLATILSTTVSLALNRESIYTLKLVRRGVSLAASTTARAVQSSPVYELMLPARARVGPSASLEKIAERAHHADAHQVYVIDRKRKLLGVITLDDIAAHVGDPLKQRRRLRAQGLMHAPEFLRRTDPLSRCIELLENRSRDELPVVDGTGRLDGRVTRADVLAHYSREVLRGELVLAVEHEEQATDGAIIHLDTGEVREEVVVGGGLEGKTLRELDVRTRFGVNIYAIRSGHRPALAPDPDTPLARGDRLIAVGRRESIERLRAVANAGDGQ